MILHNIIKLSIYCAVGTPRALLARATYGWNLLAAALNPSIARSDNKRKKTISESSTPQKILENSVIVKAFFVVK